MKTTRIRIFPTAAFAGLLLGALVATPARAQSSAPLPVQNSGPAASVDTPSTDHTPDVPGPASEGNWHVDPTFYLWTPGLHGNVQAFNYNVGFKASFSDLFKKLDFGTMGAVGIRYKNLVLTDDLLYMALSVNNTKVFQLPGSPQLSSEVKERIVIFTPKIGLRVMDTPRIKIDALTGIRYWHFGTTLTLTPNPFASSNAYVAHDWVDPLVGGRILVPLSPKMMATFAGDVGGWGTGSKLEYQMIAALGYKINPKMTLEAGLRYLYLDYSRATNFSSQVALNGAILGMTYRLK